MIQPKTLDALNYFLDEDIESCILSLEQNLSDQLNAYYKGRINSLKYAKELINQEWIPDDNS
jgi:hypothetical protein